MRREDKAGLTRRDMLKLGIGGAGMFALSAGALTVPRGIGASGGGGVSGSTYIEAFPPAR